MGNGEFGVADRLRSQQKALAEFGLHAFRYTDLDEILQRATELVSQGLDVKLTKVVEVLPGGDELLFRAGVNWKPGIVGQHKFSADPEASPAGYALALQEPVVSRDVAAETRFKIPEVLVEHGIQSMVNVLITGEERPFGVLEVDAPRHRDFDDDDVAFLQNYANLVAAAVGRHRAYRALDRQMREQRMLIQELEHRVKNMLGLVQSLAQQTTAEDEGARGFQQALVGRLQALARAEGLAFEDHAQEIDLRQLVERSIEPFARADRAFSIDGQAVRLPARGGRIMALVLHELGTNATKHGALSGPGGNVRISWTIAEGEGQRQLRFRWAESGGPAVTPPQRTGFGTKLLTRLASYELDGEARLENPAEGLQYRLDFPAGTA